MGLFSLKFRGCLVNFVGKIQSFQLSVKFPQFCNTFIFVIQIRHISQKKSDWFESDYCALLTMVDNKLLFKQPVKSA